MRGWKGKKYFKRAAGIFLSAALSISGIGIGPAEQASAAGTEGTAGAIEITSAADLQLIGKDNNHPMDGDYVLTANIDLSSGAKAFEPIGGGTSDTYGAVAGDNVFSGTFDGKGHTISGLTINSTGSSSKYNMAGLFASVGSDNPSDYAEIKNINFEGVNIMHTLGKGDLIGTLAADVNGYVKIDNVAVSSGAIAINYPAGNATGDLLGVGGLIGQTRTDSQRVLLSNLYNAAAVTVSSVKTNQTGTRCGGIIGRIHHSITIGSMTSCVNVGTIQYGNASGYAINGYSTVTDAAGNTANIKNCYFLSNSGIDFGASQAKTADELASTQTLESLGMDYWIVDKDASNQSVLLPKVSKNQMPVSIPSPVFASGDSAGAVQENFTLPTSYTPEGSNTAVAITWTSSDADAVSIDDTGNAVVKRGIVDTDVTLTATAGALTKHIIVTVLADPAVKISISLDKPYAKVGEAITASVTGASGQNLTYSWTVGNGNPVSGASFTPAQTDLNKFLTVTAALNGKKAAEKKIYCSRLPVVYIDTDDGGDITSKTEYKTAQMHIQGNDTFNSTKTTLYDGATEIRGRGNTTWDTRFNKLPYKLKLDTKTDLFGFGESKHWVLLANYMDESLIRNKTSYDLAGEMGLTPYLQSAHVELVLNGAYAGNYLLTGNVRIEQGKEGRVNIRDWEKLAGDVASAIKKKYSLDKENAKALEDHLTQNLAWITSGKVTWNGTEYDIATDYSEYNSLKRNGKIDVSGGFLFELDGYFDEISRFYTADHQPMMLKSPEYLRPVTGPTGAQAWGALTVNIQDDPKYSRCNELYNYALEYIQAAETSMTQEDFLIEVKSTQVPANATSFREDFATEGKSEIHYSDLVDMDSLVRYLMINEFYWNTETMKKSTYMYKDVGVENKLIIGPVWDMDWTSDSLVSSYQTGNPRIWMVTNAKELAQQYSWYRSLIKDPYFVQKMYECYRENRAKFEEIIKSGGTIDTLKSYLQESAQANYEGRFMQSPSPFETETTRFKNFLTERLAWMDQQFGWSADAPDEASTKAALDGLLNSLGTNKMSNNISVTVDTNAPVDTEGNPRTTYKAEVTDAATTQVGFYVNGKLVGTSAVTGGKAEVTVKDSEVNFSYNPKGSKNYVYNVVQVRAMGDNDELLMSNGSCISNYNIFRKATAVAALKGTVTVYGTAKVGGAMIAKVTGTNNNDPKTLAYQWMAKSADTAGTDAYAEITGATTDTYIPTAEDIGKTIICRVTSSAEEGEIASTASPAVTELANNHLLINQTFGGGDNEDASISHSFVELYNPTGGEISLDGYWLGYSSGRTGESGASADEIKIPLTGTAKVPSKTSYLIRFDAQHLDQNIKYQLVIDDFDQEGIPTGKDKPQIIANKQYRFILYDKNNQAVDGVSVFDTPAEGSAVKELSKHKTARRSNFADTDNNDKDFKDISYAADKITDDKKATNRPRSLMDGQWDANSLQGIATITGEPKAGSVLTAAVTGTNSTGTLQYQWMVDKTEVADATAQTYTVKAEDEGKKIRVKVTSSTLNGQFFSPAAVSKLTGTVTIDGEAKVGATLTANVAETNNTGQLLYQWKADGEAIATAWDAAGVATAKATAKTCQLTEREAGKKIMVTVSSSVESGSIESAETAAVEIVVEPLTGTAVITGEAKVGSTLTAALSGGNNTGTLRYQWKADGTAIAGATAATYTLTANELGKRITVAITSSIQTGTKESSQTAAVTEQGGGSGPVALTGTAVITGEAKVGKILTAVLSGGNNTGTLRYQWKADGTAIAGATAATYTLTASELGKKITVTITSSVQTGNNITSDPTAEVAAGGGDEPVELTGTATITGEAKVGSTLTAALTGDHPTGTLSFQWNANGTAIAGATAATYTLTASELGKTITVTITSSVQTGSITSDPTAAVAAASPSGGDGSGSDNTQPGDGSGQSGNPPANPPAGDPPKNPIAVGQEIESLDQKYQVTKADASGYEAAYTGPAKQTGKVKIPEVVDVNGTVYKITEIADGALKNNKKVTEIRIGKSVTKIGASAFEGAKKLKTIVIWSTSLKSIGKNALKGIHKNCKIKVPKKLVKQYEKIFKKKGQKSSVKVVRIEDEEIIRAGYR